VGDIVKRVIRAANMHLHIHVVPRYRATRPIRAGGGDTVDLSGEGGVLEQG
jgi:diadenosine tetraphosphate (Ap4A) HIT family hydrolase